MTLWWTGRSAPTAPRASAASTLWWQQAPCRGHRLQARAAPASSGSASMNKTRKWRAVRVRAAGRVGLTTGWADSVGFMPCKVERNEKLDVRCTGGDDGKGGRGGNTSRGTTRRSACSASIARQRAREKGRGRNSGHLKSRQRSIARVTNGTSSPALLHAEREQSRCVYPRHNSSGGIVFSPFSAWRRAGDAVLLSQQGDF